MDLNHLKKSYQKMLQINQSVVENRLKEKVLANQDEIVAKVRARWREGKRPSGQIIGNYASFSYQQEKSRRNPLAGGTVDLIDTGSLNRQLVVNHLRGSFFNVFSTDSKAVDIADKYGLDVFGLTDEEASEVIREASSLVMKDLIEWVDL
jgi:hypothetical protein